MNQSINLKNLYTVFKDRTVEICRETAFQNMLILKYRWYPVRIDDPALAILMPEYCR
jgi:hypothetical protein